MEKILILGIGNQLMMDDGLGIYIVEELQKTFALQGVTYVSGESDIDFCIGQIEDATNVIIIDAAVSGTNPGQVSTYPIADLHQQQSLDISPHNIHLFQVLYQQRNRLRGYLIGIEPFEVKFHIGLSERMIYEWDYVIAEVKKILNNLIEDFKR
ncbi:hydrogenase maturation protease [Fictibacillus sp. b24]|uniref:hydrogenase maturation protease n=1 Tax=Fictibacillus sp. b24 TaxID=3055863 RepID=UPI0025A1F08B|nr:hydrogenase maturation protease [Fictibacillus sp. b24]MDM5315429.1 hydrogenase maturation protease [Fictibacillus sp. b24]